MGLLHGYTKEGEGIDKNGPKKRGFFLFFEILFRKIWDIMKGSMIYFVASLPLLLIYYFASMPFVYKMVFTWGIGKEGVDIYTTAFSIFFSMTMVTLLGSGPASASLSYIHRCHEREEHVWLFGDFKKKFKENFKQAMFVTITDTIIIALGIFLIGFYYSYYMQNHQSIWLLAAFFLSVLMLIFILMHQYIYQLMITFENNIKELYTNAFLLTLSTVISNLFLALVVVGISFLVYLSLTPFISLTVGFFGLLGILRFLLEFHATRVIEKKILRHIRKEETKTEELAEVEE